MGQYYKILNLDKRQYIHPHRFRDGMKLLEFGSSACGTMCGLAVLLAEGNGRGGGDLPGGHPIIGSWARCRIVVAGDYADREEGSDLNLYGQCAQDDWVDVSSDVVAALCGDRLLEQELRK